MKHIITKATIIAISIVLIALSLTSCSGEITTPIGIEYRYTTNPPPDLEPKPAPNAPYEVFTYDGREYWGYDVNGDGLLDWVYDPERGVWFYMFFMGKNPWTQDWTYEQGGDAVPITQVMFGFEDFDDPNPPDSDIDAEYYLDLYDLWQEFEIGVKFTAIGGPIVYDLDENGEGTLDVTLNLSGDWYTLPPAWYAATENGVSRLEWEIYEVEPLNPENPSYVRTRIRGDSNVVAGYLLDMGVINVLDDQGNAIISGDPETREVYFNGEYVFDAIPTPAEFPSKF